MTTSLLTEGLKGILRDFFKKNKKADLLSTYFFFLEKKYQVRPVVYIREKKVYQSEKEILEKVEAEGKLWRETEIKIQMGAATVNEHTKRIYICPFTGKAFGDNTHPNPQDAIYDWVSNCPENTERVDGMKVKRFYVSEDPEVIKNYIQKRTKAVSKIVFSSGVTGKLFNSKEAVIEDFKKNQLKEIPLSEVPTQNRFQIEERFLDFIEAELDDAKISSFVEEMNGVEEFAPYAARWVEENK
ncbi:MAG: DUF2709 domain-containing protein [Simkania negevensis]|nr:DUF2709 domain-containing protein [Simkania negevensis]